MIRAALLSLALLTLSGCSDVDATRETLVKAGFTDIETHGWVPFSCSSDDKFSTAFTALNPQGNRVEGVVCCGLVFKSCTVRF